MNDAAAAERAPVMLVGAGAMALAYSRVLAATGRRHLVVGRGESSASAFADATGITPSTGPLDRQLRDVTELPDTAIVAVNAMYLTDVAEQLADAGVARLLLEKPAALDDDELGRLRSIERTTGVEIRVGYNRRFLPSVRAARAMVDEDGGVVSVKFDFSEPSRAIAQLDKPTRELDTWFYGNSSHVVDLALHFSGPFSVADGTIAGGVSWHDAAGVFVGHARSAAGALISWHANWIGPGRWGLEVITAERRLIMQPLEQLRVQTHDGFAEHPIDLDARAEDGLKPGLLGQVIAFLDGVDEHLLPRLDEVVRMRPSLELIRTGGHEESGAADR